MKIGILTYHSPLNFGANLQAYCSKCLLESFGHEVKIINYVSGKSKQCDNEIDIKAQGHIEFVRNYLCNTPELYTGEEIYTFVKKEGIQLIVIGADAVWSKSNKERLSVFYGKWLFESDLADKVAVVSMSVAFMGDTYKDLPQSYKQDFSNCLKKFAYVTVRDEWTRERINDDIFGYDFVENVNPDPVIWLSDYLKDYQLKYPDGIDKMNYIVMSLPVNWNKSERHRKWFTAFKDIVHENGLRLVELPLPEGLSGMDFDYTVHYPINPLDWFCWIRDARAFCGLRFHAVVSCISCGVPFFSIDVYGKSSKSVSVINRLGGYDFVGKFDKKSKIWNLLHNTKFDKNRVHGNIDVISPQEVYNRITKIEREDIIHYRDALRSKYRFHLDKMFSKVGSFRKDLKIFELDENCTGCAACVNACPTGALRIGESRQGFYYPELTPTACIDCKKCEKVCPKLLHIDYQKTRHAYYGWHKDDVIRLTSSSGGAFTALSNCVQQMGGIVYGASFDYFKPIRLECHSTEEVALDELKRSKYVQNHIGDAFKRIKADLQNGRCVLYCGTPCQVAGLKAFLGKEYANLLTCDFVCHGVASMDLLRKHLNYLGFEQVKDINFRPKKRGAWVDNIIISDGNRIYDVNFKKDPYFLGFMKNISLRKSCYSCEYAQGYRASDLTLADFGGVKRWNPDLYDRRGLSLILVNTEIGAEWLRKATDDNVFVLHDLDLDFANYVYKYNGQGYRYDRDVRDRFINDVYSRGYKYAIRNNRLQWSSFDAVYKRTKSLWKK